MDNVDAENGFWYDRSIEKNIGKISGHSVVLQNDIAQHGTESHLSYLQGEYGR